jgi:ABC-type multidrug transport system ATPase subunit
MAPDSENPSATPLKEVAVDNGEENTENKEVEVVEEFSQPDLFFWPRPLVFFGQLWAFAIRSLTLNLKNWRALLNLFVVVFLLLCSLVFFEVLVVTLYEGTIYPELRYPSANPFPVVYDENVNAKAPPFFYYLGSGATTYGSTLMSLFLTPAFSLLPIATQTPYPVQPTRTQFNSIGALEQELYDRFADGNDVYGAATLEDVQAASLRYNIYYNKTFALKQSFGSRTETLNIPAFINSVNQAYFSTQAQSTSGLTNATLNTLQKGFPTRRRQFRFDIQSQTGTFYYMFMFVLMLPLFAATIVADKERNLVLMMRLNGAIMSAYWIISYVTYLIIYLAIVALVLVFSAVMQWRWVTQNSPLLYLAFFFCWGQWIIAAAFLLGTLFSKEKSASVIGYLIVFGGCLSAYVLDDVLIQFPPDLWVRYLVAAWPFIAYCRALNLLVATTGDEFRGLTYANFLEVSPNSFTFLCIMVLLNALVMLLLAIYLDLVVPSGDGVKKHPLFFIVDPIRWIMRKARGNGEKFTASTEEMEQKTVAKEVSRVLAEETGSATLRILGISRSFSTSIIPSSWRAKLREKLAEKPDSFWSKHLSDVVKPDTQALTDLILAVQTGDCVGLLGPNGAGKTTALNSLAGVINPSSGTAEVCGMDMCDFRSKASRHIGLCPQYDYLSPELTATEMLMFYGRLRGLHGRSLRRSVEGALKQVNLTFAKSKRCGMYSGGMRRRLSLAVALLTNPDLLLLDEPTTGLDPHSRRDVWECLNVILKGHRAVLLATHSMAEAEFLCSRVNIIQKGVLKAVGSVEELRETYANVMHLEVTIAQERAAELEEDLKALSPSIRQVEALNMNHTFFLDFDAVKFSDLYAYLTGEKARSLEILDWGIYDGSLEDTFNVVTAEADTSLQSEQEKE